jgi:hypothetical protein
MKARLLAVASLASLVVVLSGCGEATHVTEPAVAEGEPTGVLPSTSSTPEALVGVGIVLDDGEGPELCLGAVMESLPPQCSGPRVIGWSWADFPDEESAAGTRWTDDVVVVGSYEGNRFTLTEPAVPLSEYDGPRPPRSPEHPLDTPCPEPLGGWRTDHPGTMADFERAAAAATGLDGYAGSWVDYVQPPDPSVEGDGYQPHNVILNVRVVGDRTAAAAELRRIWPGPVCVSTAERTEAELRRIQQEVIDVDGMLTSSAGFDVVDLRVVYDDGSLQRRMDERYGKGVVRVSSALAPWAHAE